MINFKKIIQQNHHIVKDFIPFFLLSDSYRNILIFSEKNKRKLILTLANKLHVNKHHYKLNKLIYEIVHN